MYSTDTSLKSLLRDLIGELSELIRQELRLAQAEASQKLSQAQISLIAIATGLLLAVCALLILLQAVVIALAQFMPAWAASLTIGAIVAIAAFILVRQGHTGFSATTLIPERTLESVRRDKDLVMEKIQS